MLYDVLMTVYHALGNLFGVLSLLVGISFLAKVEYDSEDEGKIPENMLLTLGSVIIAVDAYLFWGKGLMSYLISVGQNSPLGLTFTIAAVVAIGVFWSLFKWRYLLIPDKVKKVQAIKHRYLAYNQSKSEEAKRDGLREALEDKNIKLNKNRSGGVYFDPPIFRMFLMAIFWPISMLMTVIFRSGQVWTTLYNVTFGQITKRMTVEGVQEFKDIV